MHSVESEVLCDPYNKSWTRVSGLWIYSKSKRTNVWTDYTILLGMPDSVYRQILV